MKHSFLSHNKPERLVCAVATYHPHVLSSTRWSKLRILLPSAVPSPRLSPSFSSLVSQQLSRLLLFSVLAFLLYQVRITSTLGSLYYFVLRDGGSCKSSFPPVPLSLCKAFDCYAPRPLDEF